MSTKPRRYPMNHLHWSGIHVDGPRAGEVSRHRADGSTMTAMVMAHADGTEPVPIYVRGGHGVMFTVWYRREQVTPIADGDWFWLTEVGRVRYDGVL